MNPDIDNDIWSNPAITYSQKTNLLKFRIGRYMGSASKQLIVGMRRFLSITCLICNSFDAETWHHVFLNVINTTYMPLESKDITKQYGKLGTLSLSSQKSRCYTLMNARTFNNNPQENTIPIWLLCCTCRHQKCHCNARFKPDLLCIRELPHQYMPPTNPIDNLTIQFKEITYTNDISSQNTVNNKI